MRARSLSRRAISSLAVLGLASAACSGRGARHAAGSDHPLVGASAPALSLPTPDERGEVNLSEYAGKVVVVDFWATWCEPCRKSFPEYQRLVDGAGGKLVVIGVSVDEDPEGVPDFVRETGVSFHIAWDKSQSAAGSYRPPTMPTSYVIDKNGIVRFVHAGYTPGDEVALKGELDSLY